MTETTLNIAENRRAQKWTRLELLGRLLWEICERPLFRWTPRQLWVWRRFVLRAFGAKIGSKVQIHPTARIAIPWNLKVDDASSIGDCAIVYNLGPIEIGPSVTVSQNSHLCAGSHDYSKPEMPLLKAKIVLAADVWICADAFVGPGVSIGTRSIVAARAVVVKTVGAGLIVGGHPAVEIGKRL